VQGYVTLRNVIYYEFVCFIYYLVQSVQTCSGAHLASFSINNEVLFPGVKRPGRQTCRSSPSGAEFKNEWSSATTDSPICVGCLQRDDVTY